MKVNDEVICVKDLKFSFHSFTKNDKYIIVSLSDKTYHDGQKYEQITLKKYGENRSFLGLLWEDFNEHFETLKNIRKSKLKTLKNNQDESWI